MRIYRNILGNIGEPQWSAKLGSADISHIELDQWTAQKSRFVARDNKGEEYAIALKRGTHIHDGDILDYDSERNRLTLLRLRLNDIMVIDMAPLTRMEPQTIISTAVELGHAIGNQHWPAVVHATKVYVPLTVDRKVMQSVMNTHNIEHIAISFRSAEQVTPYLSPQEIRRLLAPTAHTHTDEQHTAEQHPPHFHHQHSEKNHAH